MKNEPSQLTFEEVQPEADNGPVVCLGMTFKNDEERREYFREELRKKLPELRKIEGFPIGDDEDIIALSDPPYYTACPNPWINDFIEEWEKEKVEKYGRDVNEEYHREPFASDVSEGKNDPIYNAHSYHTKVPHRAIMRYLLHYTEPGDIVFDGFGGSGMTAVAAKMCGDKKTVEELLEDKNSVKESIINKKIGKRNSIVIDLAPSATFMSHVYNKSTDKNELELLKRELLKFVDKYSWTFLTIVEKSEVENIVDKFQSIEFNDLNKVNEFFKINANKFGKINYIVWSDVYSCPTCSVEINYWESFVEKESKKVKKNIRCKSCGKTLEKAELERVFVSFYDKYIQKSITIPKQVPVLINYTFNKKRYEKEPDSFDKLIINKFSNYHIQTFFPKEQLNIGDKLNEPLRLGITNTHHFYTDRILFLLSKFLEEVKANKWLVNFLHGSILPKMTKMNRYMPQHGSRALVGPMANALYFPPMNVENNVLSQLEFQFKKIYKALRAIDGGIVSTQSSSQLIIEDNSIDYIFLDPPFGANIMYSELSYLRECWLRIKTNNKDEAIENKSQGKDIDIYTKIMTECLKEAYRILKPGKWITIEFSNTKASVWNAIQKSIQEAGFIVASVDALDKKRGGFHAMITTTAVKQDLVISAYKPKKEDIVKIMKQQNTKESAWSFIIQHLGNLPVFKGEKGKAQIISERTPRILFDRMVAYHVQHGLPVPISSAEFQAEVAQRFPMRDGMVFLESQVAEYDKKRTLVKEFTQLSLFVSDENSAIEWIRQQLMKKPQTRQDLHPNFMKEIQHIAKHEELPELDELLEQNFLRYDGDGPVPDQIISYLRRNYKDLRGIEPDDSKVIEKAMHRWYVPNPNKQADLERLREKALLREFEGYITELEGNRKKLRNFRTEAVRAGFKKAYSEKDFETIVKVGERIPEKILQEDDKLLMYYDNACIRLGL